MFEWFILINSKAQAISASKIKAKNRPKSFHMSQQNRHRFASIIRNSIHRYHTHTHHTKHGRPFAQKNLERAEKSGVNAFFLLIAIFPVNGEETPNKTEMKKLSENRASDNEKRANNTNEESNS